MEFLHTRLSKIVTLAAVLFCFSMSVFAAPYFSGSAGGGLKFKLEPKDIPDFLIDAYFKGQFDFSQFFTLRLAGSLYATEALFQNGLYRNVGAMLNLDEIMLSYHGSVGQSSHYVSLFLGDCDPVGGDSFLRRHQGMPAFQTRLTESICGVNQARIFDMNGLGGSYIADLPGNVSLGVYCYYNKKGLTSFSTNTVISDLTTTTSTSKTSDLSESLNTDFRFAGAWPNVALDFVFGANMPIERTIVDSSGTTEKVIALIRRADLHLGFSAFFGSTNSTSLLLQTGFSRLVVKPEAIAKLGMITLDDVYLFLEPKFVTPGLVFSFALFNFPANMLTNLCYVSYPVGFNLTFSSPWVLAGGRKSQFGIMGTAGLKNSITYIIKNAQTIFTDFQNVMNMLEVTVSPFGTVYFGTGQMNFSLNVNCLSIKSWQTFCDNFSFRIGYKQDF